MNGLDKLVIREVTWPRALGLIGFTFMATKVGLALAACLTLIMVGVFFRRRALDWMWEHRHEVGALGGAAVGLWLLEGIFGQALGSLVWTIAVAAGLIHPRGREWLRSQLRFWQDKRKWQHACHSAGLYMPGRTARKPDRREPCLRNAERTRVGVLLRLTMNSGWTATDIQRRSEGLATSYRAFSAEVAVNPHNAGHVTVLIRTRDPLADSLVEWQVPHDGAAWTGVPIGVNEHGGDVTVRIAGRHVLLGGTIGSGKSVAQSLLLAACAIDTNIDLTLLDGKRVEMKLWEDVAVRSVGPDIAEANAVLQGLNDEMRDRLDDLVAQKRRGVRPGDRLHVVFVDELAYYTDIAGTKEERAIFTRLLRNLVALGRAAGICVIAATQRPAADIIDSSLRAEFSTRIALRVNDWQGSDMILGPNLAKEGFDASRLEDSPGLAYLKGENTAPVRIRCANLTDEDIRRVVAHALELRGALVSGPERTTRPTQHAGDPSTTGNPASLPDDSPLSTKGEGSGRPDGWQEPPVVVEGATGDAGEGSAGPALASRGSRTPLQRDLEAKVMEFLNGVPRSGGEVARAVGKASGNGSVRRTLARLEADGRVVRTTRDGGWVAAGQGEAS